MALVCLTRNSFLSSKNSFLVFSPSSIEIGQSSTLSIIKSNTSLGNLQNLGYDVLISCAHQSLRWQGTMPVLIALRFGSIKCNIKSLMCPGFAVSSRSKGAMRVWKTFGNTTIRPSRNVTSPRCWIDGERSLAP